MRMRGKKPIFSYKDTWSLSHTLDPIISAGLEKFLEVGRKEQYRYLYGIPSSLAHQGYTQEQWFELIEKMIYAFKAEENEPEYHGGWEKGEHDGEMWAVEGLIRWHRIPSNPELWDQYLIDSEEHEAKVKEGLELFAKYYRSIWW